MVPGDQVSSSRHVFVASPSPPGNLSHWTAYFSCTSIHNDLLATYLVSDFIPGYRHSAMSKITHKEFVSTDLETDKKNMWQYSRWWTEVNALY